MRALTWSSSWMNSHGISLRRIFPKMVSSAGSAAIALLTSSDIVSIIDFASSVPNDVSDDLCRNLGYGLNFIVVS